MGACQMQWSILWWARHHRAHHRYVDTDRDPYNARRGLLWSHIGWLLTHSGRESWGEVDMSDLENDSVVQWQHKHYTALKLLVGISLPTLVAHFGWNDSEGGFLYASLLRVCITWHGTFLVNSVAHWVGTQPYSDKHTPRENVWLALITFGEGYHNFHHEFPNDYRNGVRWYDFDPSKWAIWLWARLGLTSHLNRASSTDIEKCRMKQLQKKSRLGKRNGQEHAIRLPVIEWEQYVAMTQKGLHLISVAGIVHDVTEFMAQHPGGEKLIWQAIGTDATSMFHGGVYDHSTHANNLLEMMQVGVIRGGGQIETSKKEN
ncbi:hypothetical protein N7474_009593 [Penicillium riverlandense]|uniref:uncharacterized protein n=1 Tax=Penicillium riverlandense TaxID=1903569 RepID=UPI0025477B17|nr:uncharacterized protein N7474_009593 [Penicillium riverlandense]KAJ5808324.1 hypothetical protein N7474_009593 [Penicillium riverlandense]